MSDESSEKPEPRKTRGEKSHLESPDFFDLEGSDPELLNTGRIPDPQPGHTPLFRWMARVLVATEARLRARGAQPVRGLIRFFWGFIAIVGIFLLVGPIINPPMDIDDIIASADLEEVDWFARDVALDYTIGRDDEGAFTAEVNESFTMFFRDDRSVSEVERTVVTEFEGHDVDFDLHSVTIDGVLADVKISRDPSMTTIHIAPADGSKLSEQHEIALTYDLQNLVVSEIDKATDRTVDLWSWPLFASWPQATSGIEASFTFAPEVNDAMIRAPRAYVGWLLVSATQRLEPEAETAAGVRYSFSNSDNLPPNADFWINASFAPGTFAQPPTTPLFWVQTWGPLVPLAFLGALLLFGLAARRIVWADSAGAPWFVSRSEPPNDLEPPLAAQLMRKPWHAELVSALRSAPSRVQRPRASRKKRETVTLPEVASGHARPSWLAEVARVGRRTGRIGDLPAAIAQRAKWSTRKPDPIIEQQLRWIPDSYLRDTFLLAPLAITLIQWGLLRQLSNQVILTVLWFPFAIVVVSTALALTTVWAVRKPRPLTPAGAKVMQELKGIHVFAQATRLTERGPLDDPLLPYAMLFESPRHAGTLVTEQAIAETGDRNIDRGWRTGRFLSGSAIVAFSAALAVLAGAIVSVSTIAPPYGFGMNHATSFGGDLPGISYSQSTGFEIEAALDRGEDGTARLQVSERHRVDFDSTSSWVPQFAREWPTSRLGQNLGLEDIEMRIDGAPVDIRIGENPETLSRYAMTQLEDVLSGLHDVEITYALSHPVVAAGGGAEAIEQLRWTALYSFWEDEYWIDQTDLNAGRAPVRPIRIQFTLAADLVDAVRSGGWITSDYERPQVRREIGNWYSPWEYERTTYLGNLENAKRYELLIGDQTTAADGSLVVTLDAEAVQSRQQDTVSDAEPGAPWIVDEKLNQGLGSYELDLGSDVGVRIDFAEGTFTGIHPESFRNYEVLNHLPYVALLVLAILVILGSAVVIFFAVILRAVKQRGSASNALIGYGAIPIAAIAQCVLFFWVIGPAPGDDSRIPAAMILGGLMLAAVTAEIIFTARTRPPLKRSATTHNKR